MGLTGVNHTEKSGVDHAIGDQSRQNLRRGGELFAVEQKQGGDECHRQSDEYCPTQTDFLIASRHDMKIPPAIINIPV